MKITKEDLQKSLNKYLSTPGLLFVAGQGAMGFANQLVVDLGRQTRRETRRKTRS
jgi:hypothetical protein